MKKRGKQKGRKKTSDTCYLVFYELFFFFPLLPKGRRLDSKSDMEFFWKKFLISLDSLYCLTTKIFEVRYLLTVLCAATRSQLLPGYLNRTKKFISYKEKGCNTFSLVISSSGLLKHRTCLFKLTHVFYLKFLNLVL